MSEKSTGMANYSVDFDDLPQWTAEEKEQLAQLKTLRDDEIDFSDIPSQAGRSGWSRRGLPPEQMSAADLENGPRGEMVALETDVLEFFLESGDASPGRINAVLREYARAHRKTA